MLADVEGWDFKTIPNAPQARRRKGNSYPFILKGIESRRGGCRSHDRNPGDDGCPSWQR
jgi:hypothetical protein